MGGRLLASTSAMTGGGRPSRAARGTDPLGDLGATIRVAVLFEFADWQRTMRPEEVSYPISHAIVRMLDWLIQHQPDRDQAVVAEIVGEAERGLNIAPEVTGFSLRQAAKSLPSPPPAVGGLFLAGRRAHYGGSAVRCPRTLGRSP